jgi:thiazole tautomerase (transcriptional regulator TenI)
LFVSATSGALLVINDRVDAALAIGASTVQLGSASLFPRDVVRIAPALCIGVSVHDVETAQTLVAQTPSQVGWVMVGHVYDTRSHPETPGRGLDMLSAVTKAVSTPVIAVGGIRPEHVITLLQAGATGVAVVSGIWSEWTPKDAAMRYLSFLW